MDVSIKLTDTQRQVLEHAVAKSDGRIAWFPDNINGGARQKVIRGLLNRGLVTGSGMLDCCISADGYAALGREQALPAIAHTAEIETNVAAVKATVAKDEQELIEHPLPSVEQSQPVSTCGKSRIREHSKQAIVIQMLRRSEGATIAQICDKTGWLDHTTRGFLAGSVKKKLGLTLTSVKPGKGADRTYHLPT